MADQVIDRSFVVSEILCFLRAKFGKLTDKQLKQVLHEFYNVAMLSEAKDLLLVNVETLKLDKWPRPSRRRDSDNKARLDSEDIVNLWSFLDENKLTDKLPRYVAENIELVPSSNLCEGDLSFLMNKFDALETVSTSKFDQIFAQLSSVQFALQDMQTKINIAENNCLRMEMDTSSAPIDLASHAEYPPLRTVESTSLAGAVGGQFSMGDKQPNTQQQQQRVSRSMPAPTKLSWAAQTRPRNSHVQAGNGSIVTTDDDNAFIEVTRRKKRSRTTTTSYSPVVQSDQQRSNDNVNRKKDNLKIIGKLNANNSRIKASQVLIDKSVYCVSNISVDYNCQDLIDYLKDCNISVVSCFAAKTKFENSNAFRVCVATKDKEKLLDANIWPCDVIIRNWVFKGNQPARQNG